MKTMSRRARRLQRRQALRKVPGLNLVSLMDIFTILVFFLLVNGSNERALPSQKVLTLPESRTEGVPDETLQVMVTREEILVQGRRVMEVRHVDGEADMTALKQALEEHRSPTRSGSDEEITVVADRSVPYKVVRRIVETGQSLAFSRVAFAASQMRDQDQGVSP